MPILQKKYDHVVKAGEIVIKKHKNNKHAYTITPFLI